MAAACERECIVHAQGVPHGPDLSCRCTPCNAVRQQIDLWLASREDGAPDREPTLAHAPAEKETPIIMARCVPLLISTERAAMIGRDCSAAVAAEDLGLRLQPEPGRVRVLRGGGAYSLEYQGLWCIKIAEVQTCSRSHVHLRFRRLCQVEITHATQEGGGHEVVHTYFGDVRQPGESEFLEQWTTRACAEDLLQNFAKCEEVWLQPGDTAWEQEANGRTVLAPEAGGQAVWHLGSSRFAVLIEKGDAAQTERTWCTADLAQWVQSMEACCALPSSVLETTAWVCVPNVGFQDADLYVRRLRDEAGGAASPAVHLAERFLQSVTKHEVAVYRSPTPLVVP